jgi:predicted MFS family arabinose efflux permease
MAPHARGTGLSLFSAGWSGGQAAGAALMGAGIAAFGYTPMYVVFGLGLAVLGFWLRRNFSRFG